MPARGSIRSQFTVSRRSIARRLHGSADRFGYFCRNCYYTNLFYDLVLAFCSHSEQCLLSDGTHCEHVMRFYPFLAFKLETNSALPTTSQTHNVKPHGGVALAIVPGSRATLP